MHLGNQNIGNGVEIDSESKSRTSTYFDFAQHKSSALGTTLIISNVTRTLSLSKGGRNFESIYLALLSNEGGSDTTCQILTYLTTRTEEIRTAPRFSVFPNPVSSGLVQVVLPEAGVYSYRLTDSYGRQVRTGILEERVSRLQVSGYMPSGVYFLHIEGLGVRSVVCGLVVRDIVG